MLNLSKSEGIGALAAALGTVVAVDGAQVVVEVIGAGGASAIVSVPAVHHAPYAVNNKVLVLFQGRDPATAVVAGRVGVVADAFDAAALLHADGSVALSADWDVGGGVHVATEEVRARSSTGLLLADQSGTAGLFVADGGTVGIGALAPLGVLHLWDGIAGHLFASYSGVSATARTILSASAVTQYVRIDALASNGTARAFLGFGLQPGGTTTQNLATGGDTWQFRLNGDGSVDVRRTAGSGSGTVVVRVMWV